MSEYKLLGQTIGLGGIVNDLWTTENCTAFNAVPSFFDPIRYIQENEETFPTNDTVYEFRNDFYVDGDPLWAFGIFYSDATHFRIGYKFRQLILDPTDQGAWNSATPYQIMTWQDGYAGAVRGNITNEDRWRNGLYFWRAEIFSAAYTPSHDYDGYGYSIGFVDIDNITPVENLETVIYSYDDGLTPPRYIYNGGMEYTIFGGGGGIQTSHRFGACIYQIFALFAEDITDFTEDYGVPAGGGGDYGYNSFQIGRSSLPTLSITDLGIATMWAPDESQMRDLTTFLWSSSFEANIIKLLTDPLENIIECAAFPIDLSSLRDTAREVKVGNVGTGVNMQPLKSQYIYVDCGGINTKYLKEKWGSMMDYACTTFSMFLPFIGFFEMSPDEIKNSYMVSVGYNVDLLSGDFIAEIEIRKNQPKNTPLSAVLYHKAGNMALQFPLTGANYGQMYAQALRGVAKGAMGAMFGGVGAAAAGFVDSAIGMMQAPAERSGAYSGSSGILGCFQPYLVMTSPIQLLDKNYGEFDGFPCYLSYKISKLSGYIKAYSVIDNQVKATDTEKKMIEDILQGGFYR